MGIPLGLDSRLRDLNLDDISPVFRSLSLVSNHLYYSDSIDSKLLNYASSTLVDLRDDSYRLEVLQWFRGLLAHLRTPYYWA